MLIKGLMNLLRFVLKLDSKLDTIHHVKQKPETYSPDNADKLVISPVPDMLPNKVGTTVVPSLDRSCYNHEQ